MFSVINDLLAETNLKSVRMLMAFARGPGVALVSESLTTFIQAGGRVEAILGLDLGGTSPDALQSLHGLGVETFVFGVEGDRTFHPKVLILEDADRDEFVAVIGSNNLTLGGLDSNFEASLVVRGRRSDSSEDAKFAEELDELWETYRTPKPPLTEGHLCAVDTEFITTWAPKMAQDSVPARDELRGGAKDEIFSKLDAPREPRLRPPRVPITTPPTTSASGAGLPTTLYLEVPGVETGALGEVQLPLEVLGEYFGIKRTDTYNMRLEHPDGTIEINKTIAIYPNSTFRISSPKFREITEQQRPMILRFDRTGDDVFVLTILLSGTNEFTAATLLLDRGGAGSKRWGTS